MRERTLDMTSPRGILLSGMWFGLGTGVAELILVGIKKYLLGRFVLLSPHAVWMTPVADMLIFLVPGAILALVETRWPGKVSTRLVLFCCLFLSALSLLLMYALIYRWAVVLLAVGLSFQGSRILSRYQEGLSHLIGTTLPPVGGSVILMATGLWAVLP